MSAQCKCFVHGIPPFHAERLLCLLLFTERLGLLYCVLACCLAAGGRVPSRRGWENHVSNIVQGCFQHPDVSYKLPFQALYLTALSLLRHYKVDIFDATSKCPFLTFGSHGALEPNPTDFGPQMQIEHLRAALRSTCCTLRLLALFISGRKSQKEPPFDLVTG